MAWSYSRLGFGPRLQVIDSAVGQSFGEGQASNSESSFQINKRFADLRIVENTFILLAEPLSLKNFASLQVYSNLA
jgi:hypothetical protein